MSTSECDTPIVIIEPEKNVFLKKYFLKNKNFHFFLDFSMFFENEFWRKKMKKMCFNREPEKICPSTEFYNLPPGEALDTKV